MRGGFTGSSGLICLLTLTLPTPWARALGGKRCPSSQRGGGSWGHPEGQASHFSSGQVSLRAEAGLRAPWLFCPRKFFQYLLWRCVGAMFLFVEEKAISLGQGPRGGTSVPNFSRWCQSMSLHPDLTVRLPLRRPVLTGRVGPRLLEGRGMRVPLLEGGGFPSREKERKGRAYADKQHSGEMRGLLLHLPFLVPPPPSTGLVSV